MMIVDTKCIGSVEDRASAVVRMCLNNFYIKNCGTTKT